MKILMVATVPMTLSGFLLPFAEHFRSRGWRVDGLARGITGDADCVRGFDRVWDVDWSRNPLRLDQMFRTPAAIRELVTREGYDLVHVHTPVAAFMTRFALRRQRRHGRPRVIYTAHGFHFHSGGPRLKGAAFLALEKLAGRWTDYLVVINREDEAAARRHGIVPADRIRYMPGIGVDTSFYAPERISDADIARTRRELELPDDAVVFLLPAEFNPGKRHRDAVAALARCGRENAVLVCAGTGPLMDAVRRQADALGLGSRVRLIGYRNDIPTLIRLARATVLPSEREGLPRSLMESLSLGVPAIGTRIRGIADLLEDGRGLLVPVGDVPALAEAMRRLVDQPDEARALGERGRRGMAAYDLRAIINLHEELYDEALRTLPAAGGRDLAASR